MLKIDFYGAEKILRLTPITQQSVLIGENILRKHVRVFSKLDDVQISSFDELWELQFSTASSTYSLYVYALYPVSYLLNAFEVTADVKYLHKARDLSIAFLWWESREDKKISSKRKKILFGDHATSNRTQAL